MYPVAHEAVAETDNPDPPNVGSERVWLPQQNDNWAKYERI